MQQLTRKHIIIGLVLVLVGFIAWNGIQWTSRRGLDKIVVVAVPSDSTITIDGKPANNGDNYVERGTYTIRASREYFGDVFEKVDTAKQGSEPVYLLPTVNSQEAQDWLAAHPGEQQKREGIASQFEAEKQSILMEKNPVITKLPALTDHYRIDYSINQDQKLEFQITLYAIINNPSQYPAYKAQLNQYRNEALQFLTDNGVDVNTSYITYTPNDF